MIAWIISIGYQFYVKRFDTFVTCDSTERARPSKSNATATPHARMSLGNHKKLIQKSN